MSERTTVIATYTLKPEADPAAFEGLLAAHWPTLKRLGLVEATPARVFKGEGVYYELFTWRDAAAPGVAHDAPEVMAIWEPMGALCAAMAFPHVEELALG